jgi:hypothetical protein
MFGIWCEVWDARRGVRRDWLADRETGERYEFPTLDAATRFALQITRLTEEIRRSSWKAKAGLTGFQYTTRSWRSDGQKRHCITSLQRYDPDPEEGETVPPRDKV